MYTTCIQGVSTVLPPLIFEYSHEYESFRIPSRALTFKESLETGVPFVLYTNVYRKTGNIKRPCGLEFFRGSGDSFEPPKVL